MMVDTIHLPSGVSLQQPLEALKAFCLEEYAYYDGLPCLDVNRIEPMDILATIPVNGLYNANAKTVRRIHRGMAERCDVLLREIPEYADLLIDDNAVKQLEVLLHEAVQVLGVLVPVATKVLHRKRRNLIPMLDNVMIAHYLRAPSPNNLPAPTQNRKTAASMGMRALAEFRDDLRAVSNDIRELQQALSREGYSLTPVRILELIAWMSLEPNGYYRS